jgi:hypothetical protein
MNKIIQIVLLFIISIPLFQCKAQNNNSPHYFNKLLNADESIIHKKQSDSISRTGNAYQLMSLRSYLGANNAIIQEYKDDEVIEYQMTLIENIINSSRLSKDIKNNQSPFKDSFMTWVSLTKKKVFNHEVPLYESYSFFYISQFLYFTKKNGWRIETNSNKKRWDKLLKFVENNIWRKWYTRSNKTYGNNYSYFLRSRVHMGSHWAGVAMYLNKISVNQDVNKQTAILISQYDTILRNNFKNKGRGFVWNATYDDVKGTHAAKTDVAIIQDVSHGNHVVSYIVAAYEFRNPNWTITDINKLAFTLVDNIYDKSNNTFHDNVDGTENDNRQGWGNFVADGWVKLAAYNNEAKLVLKKFEENSRILKKHHQELQFKTNLNRCQLYGKE